MSRFRAQLISIIKEYRLHFRSPRWQEDLFMAEEAMYSDDFCEMLIPEARDDAQKVEDQGNFLPRPPHEEELNAEGIPDIELGNLIEGEQQRFGIRFKDRPRNLVVLGGSGVGKSVLCRGICVRVDELNQHFPDRMTVLIIIDPKSDYLDMKDILKGMVRIFSWEQGLRLGLNGPADVPPSVWIGQLTISLAARLGLIVSRTYLAAIMARLLVALNTGLGENDLDDASVARDLIWPPLKMVLEVARRKDILQIFASKADYGKTLIQMLEGLIYDSGHLFDCCNGLDLNSLIREKCHCVFNVSNAQPYITHLITDLLINQVMVRKLYLNYKCDHTDEIFVLEESDLLIDADVASFGGSLSPLDKLHRLGRELGVMSICSISGI